MESFDALLRNWELFILVAARVSSIFVTAPFFGSRNVPMNIRIMIPLSMSIILFPFIPAEHLIVEKSIISLAILVAGELAIGLILSFFCNVTFEVFTFGGFMLGRQMGFAMVSMMDPLTQDQLSLVGIFHNFMATLILLSTNGHHMLIRALHLSFDIIPISMFRLQPGLGTFAIQATSRLFVLALMFSLPVFSTLMLTNVIMGIIAKTIPEIKIFLLQLPLKIAIGLGGTAIIMPASIQVTKWLLNDLFNQLERVLELMA